MSLVGNFNFHNTDRSEEVQGVGAAPVQRRPSYAQDVEDAVATEPQLDRQRTNQSHKGTRFASQEKAESALQGDKLEATESSEDDVEQEKRDHEVKGLARQITTTSMNTVPAGTNPLEAAKDSRLDPFSDHFHAHSWAKAMINFAAQEEEHFKPRTAGFAFKNLNAWGFGSGTDYQKSVGNVALEVVGMVRKLFGVGQRKIDILRDFEGLIEKGEMLVVLGPPGSGCSTFLKTIAGETHGYVVDENSYMNYQGVSAKDMHKHFRGEAIYTAEVDVHFPMMTVADTLTFAARARAPRHTPGGVDSNTFSEHVRDVVMAMFGISHTLNTRVGNDFVRGVSGGERKRVTIAEAMLSGAPLQCWDNSTRGLDSANAIEFCKTLRLSTDTMNTTACVSIYQSPQAAYDVFDKVTVLYEGRQIYFGGIHAAKDYFIELGFDCPARQTTPDFLTSMTSPLERVVRKGFENKAPRTPDEFAARWKESQTRKKLLEDIEEYNKTYAIGGEHFERFKESRKNQQSKQQRWKSPYTLSYPGQIKLCLWRGFQRLRGDPSLTFTQLFGNSIMALVIGSVFYDLQPDTNSFYQRGALLFFAVLMNAFGSALEILTLYAQRPIVEKHDRYALYHPSAEAFASMLVDMPYKIGNAIFFNLIIYFLSHLRREPGPFFFFLLISFTLTLAMSMLFRTIASVSRTLSQALAPAAILILAIVIYTGFVIPTPYMLGWSRWINYLDLVSYGFEALMINEFTGREFLCSTMLPPYPNIPLSVQTCSTVGAEIGSRFVNGDAYINSNFQYFAAHKWRNYGIVLVFLFGLMCTYLVAAELVSSKKSKGEVLVFQRGHIPSHMKNNASDDEESNTQGEQLHQTSSLVDHTALIQKQTAVFHWQDVCYDIQIKKEHRRILDHVDGWVKPGTLTALMGVSGAGKTTLLDVLATRVTMGVISGQMLVDGRQRDASFQRKTGYVQQQDLHLPTSTVREALNFSAVLRQPPHISQKDKLAYVDEVIKLLDMQEYADAVVGVPGEGLNVEQRKRLTIGVELAAKPELLIFLDEPTSGLDSQTSWAICDLMEKLARESQQAVLFTIHQPSAMLFQRFDRLLFLAKGGKTVYFGDIGDGSETMIDYFVRNGAAPCRPEENPAEWMLGVIGAAPGSTTQQDWFQTWRSSPEYGGVQKELEWMKENRPHMTEVKTDKSSYREFAASFAVQMWEVTKRVFEQYWRTPSYIYSKAALCIASGLFIGFSFFNAPTSIQGLQNQLFAMFMLMTIFGQLVQQIMPHFVTQRALYEVRERPSKTYSWKAFMLAQIVVEIPWNSFMAVLLFFCWYYPIGLYRNAQPTDAVHERGALMFLLIEAFLLFTCTFADMIIAGMDTAETGGNIANLLFSLSLIFCGVLATPTALPGFWIFMYRVSPFTYLVSAMLSTAVADTSVVCASNEFLSIPTLEQRQTCKTYLQPYIDMAGGYLKDENATGLCELCPMSETNAFLASTEIYPEDKWRNFGIMWAYIFFNIFAAVALYWLLRVPKKPGREEKKGKNAEKGETAEKGANEVEKTG